MCEMLLPDHQIDSIRYCTALVGGRPDDIEKPLRQQMFLRALRTLPNVEISLGSFLTHKVSMRLVQDLPDGTRFVKVRKTEEKGSDVNLAVHMLHDAHRNLYDIAVLISNDSDLLGPIQIIRKELGKTVGLCVPQQHPCRVLLREVDFVKQIRQGLLSHCQFPLALTDARGTFHCPQAWQ
jgi:hypothetical protein